MTWSIEGDLVTVRMRGLSGMDLIRVLDRVEFENLRKSSKSWDAWIEAEIEGEVRSPLFAGRDVADPRPRVNLSPKAAASCLCLVALTFSLGWFVASVTRSEVRRAEAYKEADLRSVRWFCRRDAEPLDVVEEHLRRAMDWPKDFARVSIRKAIQWGTAAETPRKASVVQVARDLLQRYTLDEVMDTISNDVSLGDAEREELVRNARKLIDG